MKNEFDLKILFIHNSKELYPNLNSDNAKKALFEEVLQTLKDEVISTRIKDDTARFLSMCNGGFDFKMKGDPCKVIKYTPQFISYLRKGEMIKERVYELTNRPEFISYLSSYDFSKLSTN